MHMVTMHLIKGGGGFSDGFSGFGSFSDIFEDFFGDMGGRQTRQREQRGQDLKYEVDVDLREAYTGVKKKYLMTHLCLAMYAMALAQRVEVVLILVAYVEVLEELEHRKDFLQWKEHVQRVEVLVRLYLIPANRVMERGDVEKIES